MLTNTYQDYNSTLTLQEGLQQLRALEAAQENDASETFAPELEQELNQHDFIHVIFGCGTNLQGEIKAHVWTLFGTTLSMQQMHEVNEHTDHKSALKEIGHGRLLVTWLGLFPQLVGIIWKTKRMHQKFPVEQVEQYLHKPLHALREEFGIYF